ncbi:glycosyltransferase [Cellulomonas sp. S1-8]|uniref:glycosyltransferase n=1 Tax=Cellulomonas sp. S1-8 TaxID=2904790 RepID=UPI0022441395|nr:glycosyltransferase [Cellulomonas sp. S1-8]UZN04114.1 glycosyltransferase [Cellulomonas sp. S1-8]
MVATAVLPSAHTDATGGKALLVASTGGHLNELLRLTPTFEPGPDSLWVTFRTPQSEMLLEGRRVEYLPYIGPRDLRGTLRAIPQVRDLVRRERFDLAVSTGAAIAVGALPVTAAAGVPSTYIESVCRLAGPSVTGRILSCVPHVALRTQHESWAGGRWRPHPSVLDEYRSVPRELPRTGRRLFITLGTIRGYRFDSVVDAVLASGLADESTVWQVGETTREDLPGRVVGQLTPDEFARCAVDADVVVAHAGVGTLLDLLALGVYAVQAVRRATRGEHVDDHQVQIADLVRDHDLGVPVEGPHLTRGVLEHAATRRVVPARTPPIPQQLRRNA